MAQLLKAKKLLVAALACQLNPEWEADATLACMEVVLRDTSTLFHLFDEKLHWVVTRRQELFSEWDPDEVDKLLSHFIQFRTIKHGAFKAFIEDTAQLLELYGSEDVPLSLGLPEQPSYKLTDLS